MIAMLSLLSLPLGMWSLCIEVATCPLSLSALKSRIIEMQSYQYLGPVHQAVVTGYKPFIQP